MNSRNHDPMQRRKIEPLVIERDSLEELPSVTYLVALAQRVEWLFLQVPSSQLFVAEGTRVDRVDSITPQKARLIAEIRALLPEHTVWSSGFEPDAASLPAARRNRVGTTIRGMSRISIRRYIGAAEIEPHLDLLIAALREYRTLANMFMARLARHLGVDLSTLAASEDWHEHKPVGKLMPEDQDNATWRYGFHGIDCCFINTVTGVKVEGGLGFGGDCGNDFGTLEASFVLEFLATSVNTRPEFEPLCDLFRDSWDNVRRALHHMNRLGLLRPVQTSLKWATRLVFVSD